MVSPQSYDSVGGRNTIDIATTFCYRDEIAHDFENVCRVRGTDETALLRVNETDTYDLFATRKLGVITS
jgi:hypothetical protein